VACRSQAHGTMNAERFELSDGDCFRLRAIVTTIDRALSRFSVDASPEDPREANRGLLALWAQLVELLAVALAPEVRHCPTCKHACMRAATRCGHCWAMLVAPPAVLVRAE